MMSLSHSLPAPEAPRRPRVNVHLRRLGMALGLFMMATSVRGEGLIIIEEGASTPEAGSSAITAVECRKAGITKDKTPCVAKIGDSVTLDVRNLAGWLEKLKTDKVITSAETGEGLVAEQLPNLRLLIDEHLMKSLQPAQYTKDDPGWYPNDPAQSKAAVGRSWLEFSLKRDPANKESRADWDQVLRTSGLTSEMPLAVGLYSANRNTAHVMALPAGARAAGALKEFHFQRIGWEGWTVFGLIVLLVAAVVFFYMAVRTGMVRDTTCPVREDGLPPYSLGRCQMAFWFFLVISAFYFLWVVTGRGDTDTINSTVLSLIGISAGTALGSAIVAKNEAASSDAVGIARSHPVVVYPDVIDAAKAALAQAKAARARLDSHDPEAIAVHDSQIRALTQDVATLKGELKRWRSLHRSQWLLDVLSEDSASAGQGRVITFHRFQIVVWTLILGIVFVSEVLTKLTMPAFDSTLLILMGVSSGTYLGFKVATK